MTYRNGKNFRLNTVSDEELRKEMLMRNLTSNRFPLEVFPSQIKPFIEGLVNQYDLQASYVGLSILCGMSTAIGTSYVVTTNGDDTIPLPIWAALLGISSSGKSKVQTKAFGPHHQIQRELDQKWDIKKAGMSDEQIQKENCPSLIFRDTHIATLVRTTLNDNPKGLVKFTDELIEVINGMNRQGRNEGIDEQFLLTLWNCSEFRATRAGKKVICLPMPFVNFIGGIQYKVLPKFFTNDRDTSGFVFRFLFAIPESDRIALPNPSYAIPSNFYNPYSDMICRLYNDLTRKDHFTLPKKCVLSTEGIARYSEWYLEKAHLINKVQDKDDMNIYAGIYGKIKEYALRFAAVLHLAEKSLDANYGKDFHYGFCKEELINAETMERAIKLANYFFYSAVTVHSFVDARKVAPQEVLTAAAMLKNGRSLADIAEVLHKDRKYKMRVHRQLAVWIKRYPRVFNAIPE